MKPWYKSKTIWVNVSIFVGALTQFLPGLKTEINPDWYPWIFAAVGIANVWLRQVTSQPIK